MSRLKTPYLLLASLCLAGVATAKVIGEDDRRAPELHEADLVSATGHIVCSRTVDGRRRMGWGTGTVVGSDSTVISAAHVFVDEAGRRGPRFEFEAERDCLFRQYSAAGELIAETGFSAARYGDYRSNSGLPNQDWAVLRTSEPLPDGTVALPFKPLGFEALEGGEQLPVAIVAFHADRRAERRVPLLSEGSLFVVNYAGFARLAHTADIERMSSGAAIVHRSPTGQNVVVGINRSGANLEDFNLGVPLSLELEEALRSFAFGQVPVFRQRLASLVPPHSQR